MIWNLDLTKCCTLHRYFSSSNKFFFVPLFTCEREQRETVSFFMHIDLILYWQPSTICLKVSSSCKLTDSLVINNYEAQPNFRFTVLKHMPGNASQPPPNLQPCSQINWFNYIFVFPFKCHLLGFSLHIVANSVAEKSVSETASIFGNLDDAVAMRRRRKLVGSV